jgi:hypothetical protein
MSDLIKDLCNIASYRNKSDARTLNRAIETIQTAVARVVKLESQIETLTLENQRLRVDAEKLKGPQHWNPIYNTDPVQRACGELPDGVEIEILLENGSGTVYLVDNNCGERTMIEDCDAFNWTVHKAIDAARSQSDKEKP